MKARQTKKQNSAPVEVVRSFAFKLNCGIHGGAQYESIDFFCSQKTTVMLDEAEAASERAFKFCVKEVMRAANEHVQMLRDGTWAAKIDAHPVAKTNAAEFERRTAPRNHAKAIKAPVINENVETRDEIDEESNAPMGGWQGAVR